MTPGDLILSTAGIPDEKIAIALAFKPVVTIERDGDEFKATAVGPIGTKNFSFKATDDAAEVDFVPRVSSTLFEMDRQLLLSQQSSKNTSKRDRLKRYKNQSTSMRQENNTCSIAYRYLGSKVFAVSLYIHFENIDHFLLSRPYLLKLIQSRTSKIFV